MENKQNRPDPREHMGARIVIVLVAAAILALISAFIWPGWAHKKPKPSPSAPQTSQTSPAAPARKVQAEPLPQGASKLEQALPDYVGSYARVSVKPSTAWQKSYPIEEWEAVYDDGQGKITLIAAQWPLAGNAAGQYSSLSSSLKGSSLSSGNVTVNGAKTGSYEVKEQGNPSQSVALWQNSTCVFEASGSGDSARSFWSAFPF